MKIVSQRRKACLPTVGRPTAGRPQINRNPLRSVYFYSGYPIFNDDALYTSNKRRFEGYEIELWTLGGRLTTITRIDNSPIEHC
jgi:hypothetical protein